MAQSARHSRDCVSASPIEVRPGIEPGGVGSDQTAVVGGTRRSKPASVTLAIMDAGTVT